MANVGAWPIETVSVDQLRLDPENVRIRGIAADETAALNYLYAEEDVAALAHDILRDTYIDNELPLVIKDNGEFIVLEGNRRVSALKGLNDPDSVPSRTPLLKRLISRYGEDVAPSSIRVMLAPSREAAAPLLARLHTKNPKRSWPREQQAKFFYAQLGPTTTVDDLKRMFPSNASSIPRFIRMAEMRDLIRKLKFKSKSVQQYALSDDLTMSAFEYAHGKPLIRKAAGLEFDSDGLLLTKKLSQGQIRVIEYILASFQANTLNTRAPELKARAKEHEQFIEILNRIAEGETDMGTPGTSDDARSSRSSSSRDSAPRSEGGSGQNDHGGSNSGSGGSQTGETSSEAGTPTSSSSQRGQNRGHSKVRVDMLGIAYSGTSAGVRRRLEELRQISVKDFPNAAYYLVRSVLECSIKQYFRLAGSPLQEGKTLNAALTSVALHFSGDKRMTAIINGLNQGGRLTPDRFYKSAPALNALIHEPDAFVLPEHVHDAWEHMAPLVKVLLEEPEVSSQASV